MNITNSIQVINEGTRANGKRHGNSALGLTRQHRSTAQDAGGENAATHPLWGIRILRCPRRRVATAMPLSVTHFLPGP